MRFIVRMGILGTFLLVAVPVSAREILQILRSRPESMQEVKELLRGDDREKSIPPYLDDAQCGGWDKGLGVGDFMSTVENLPGRPHDWGGAKLSGMAKRVDGPDEDDNPNNEYQYPETAEGLTTPCEQRKGDIQKVVWEHVADWETIDGEVVREFGQREHTYAHPYFEDPACRWRFEGGAWPDFPLTPDGFIPPSNKDTWDTESPESCQDFCRYLNSFVYNDCMDVQEREIEIFDGVDGDGNVLTRFVTINVCNEEDFKYICTDERVDEEDWNAACFQPHPDIDEWSNARFCKGDQCRCVSPANTCVHVRDDQGAAPYASYYRFYQSKYERRKLDTHVPDDQEQKDMKVACFGFYDEFDPLTHRTEDKDRRCVIQVDLERMRDTQIGKGQFREGAVQDKNPTFNENQRPGGENEDQPGVFDVEKDTWYMKLGRAFSFINEKLFAERYDGDLGNVYLAYDELDNGLLNATPQINDQQLLAESNLMRAFDDTGEPRAFVRWWQEQQTRMASLLRPPVLRIVLPSAWFMGLDTEDPFLTELGGTVIENDRANRSDRIELQVEADEDVPGTALAYLERSILLHLEEEPISIVVPLGSPTEYRARAADWCAWHMREKNEKSCDNAPTEVREIIERLNEYAQRIDDYRALRAELSLLAGKLLDLQRRLLEPIAQWFREHEDALEAIVNGREKVEEELLPEWRNAQSALAELHDRTNMPWCMNQRYTAPLYQNVDLALPSRENQGEISERGLPTLPTIPRPEDVIIDFSAIAAMDGTIKVPVLKPVQIRIDAPTPPNIRKLPELPPLEPLREAIDEALGELPEVRDQLEDPPELEPPPPLDDGLIEDARGAIFRIQGVLFGLNDRYDRFWKSMGPLQPGQEQYDRQIEFRNDLKCRDWNDLPCEHPEMNLWETGIRVGSRPLVQLQEDFQSIGTRRMEPTVCLPEDDACHILNSERADPGFRWEVRGSRANDEAVDELRITILNLTQPPPLGEADPLLYTPNDKVASPFEMFPAINLVP